MRSKQSLLPKHVRLIVQVGEQLKLARLRRRLSAEQVAQRAGISRNTLYLMEKGSESSSIATLLRILIVLGLQDDYLTIGRNDELGRRLDDAKRLAPKNRVPKRRASKQNDE
jgi:transcriptional regulator with XRE-family HTH domain